MLQVNKDENDNQLIPNWLFSEDRYMQIYRSLQINSINPVIVNNENNNDINNTLTFQRLINLNMWRKRSRTLLSNYMSNLSPNPTYNELVNIENINRQIWTYTSLVNSIRDMGWSTTNTNTNTNTNFTIIPGNVTIRVIPDNDTIIIRRHNGSCICKYCISKHINKPKHKKINSNKNIECPISYTFIEEGDLYMTCNDCHYNFAICIVEHLRENRNCPMCRSEWKECNIYKNMENKNDENYHLI